eukprot:14846739-Alexandrium_andersonii.AAC.1
MPVPLLADLGSRRVHVEAACSAAAGLRTEPAQTIAGLEQRCPAAAPPGQHRLARPPKAQPEDA